MNTQEINKIDINGIETATSTQKWVRFGIAISVFTMGAVLKSPFDFYAYYFMFFPLFPFWFAKYGIPPKIIFIFFLLLVIGFYHVLVGNNTAMGLIKVWVGVFLPYGFYYMYLKFENFDTLLVMKNYLKGAYIAGCIAIFQDISYLLHFSPGYDFNMWLPGYKWGIANAQEITFGLPRAAGPISEPSSFAMLMAPAVFIVIVSWMYKSVNVNLKNYQKIIIIGGYLLTFSSTALIGFIFMGIMIALNTASFKQIVFTIVMFVALGYGGLQLEGIKSRINALKKLSDVGLEKAIDKASGIVDPEVYSSGFILYSNIDVSVKNFIAHPLTGTGLGSHPVAFKKYSIFRFLREEYLNNTNYQDANSLLNRLMSETGILGLLIFFSVVFRFYIRKSKHDTIYWVYNNGILVMIILFLIRQGNYFITGFPLFIWLYYYNHQNLQKELKEKAIQQKELLKS